MEHLHELIHQTYLYKHISHYKFFSRSLGYQIQSNKHTFPTLFVFVTFDYWDRRDMSNKDLLYILMLRFKPSNEAREKLGLCIYIHCDSPSKTLGGEHILM